MKKFRYFIFTLSLTVLLFSCDETDMKFTNSSDTLKENITPDQTGWGVIVEFVDSSFTKAILNAGRSRIFQKRFETILDEGMIVQFFSERSHQRVSKLTADSAFIDDRTKNMVAKGRVFVIADSSGTTLETKELHWNNTTEKLYSTEFVRIVSPNETLEGWAFESDQNLSNYKIFKVSGIQR